MLQNEKLFEELKTIIKQNPDLRYDDGSSDSTGEKVTAVRIPWYKKASPSWKREPSDKAEERIGDFIRSYEDMETTSPARKAAYVLSSVLLEHELISYTRNVNNDQYEDLYILVWFGWWYVGIRVRLVHT